MNNNIFIEKKLNMMNQNNPRLISLSTKNDNSSSIKYIPNFILPVNKPGKQKNANSFDFNLKSLIKPQYSKYI